MKTLNIKDTLTNIIKWVVLIAGFVMGLPLLLQTTYNIVIHYPDWVNLVCGILILSGGFISLHLIGKNSDGSTKTPEQINNAINPPKPPNV